MTTRQLTINTLHGTMYATAGVEKATGEVYWTESSFAGRGHLSAAQMRAVPALADSHAAEMLYRRGLLTEDLLGSMFPAFDRHLDRWTIGELARRGLR